jgi:LacI family transcriptional regulator
MVFIDAPSTVPGYASLGTDGLRGAYLAIEHLGRVHHHGTIGLVVGGMDSPSADPREQGWQQAIRAAGLQDGPIARVDWSREGGYEGGHRLLGSSRPPVVAQPIPEMARMAVQLVLHEQRAEGLYVL